MCVPVNFVLHEQIALVLGERLNVEKKQLLSWFLAYFGNLTIKLAVLVVCLLQVALPVDLYDLSLPFFHSLTLSLFVKFL